MKPRQLSHILLAIFLVLVAILSIADAATVPFHPDESTALYLSADFEQLFQQPWDMAWQPERQGDLRQLYRTLDAPLSRYVAGFGRWIAGLPALPVDWEWGKTWDENQQAGALPSEQLLLAARRASAALLPFSLLLLFLAVRKATNERTAWLALLLLASNALVLLHGRRAMSEGIVIFTTTLALWSLLAAQERPWLAGLAAGLAFCAKHTLLVFVPLALLVILWQPGKAWAIRMRQSAVFGLVFLVIVVLLNPFLWAHPVQAMQAAIANRQDLAARQVADRAEQALNSPGMKLIGLLGSVYLTPPIFAETGNYTEQTLAAEEAYLANPLHNLLRDFIAGTLIFLIGLAGFVVAIRKALKVKEAEQRPLVMLLIISFVQTVALLVVVPLPFQRYYMPLVPFACIWTAVGVDAFLATIPWRALRRSPGQTHPAAHLPEK